MVAAALKFATGSAASASVPTYANADVARLDVNNALNWYEVQGEYEWPDFMDLGHNFASAMRLRRQLVHDVYVAMGKAGSLKIIPGLSVSVVKVKRGIGEYIPDSQNMKDANRRAGNTSQKRQCKREEEEPHLSNIPAGFTAEDKFLVEAMREMIARTNLATVDALIGSFDKLGLVNTLHDGLVAVWDKPKTSWGLISPELKRKASL